MSSGHHHVAVVLSLYDTGLAAIRSLGRLGIPVVGIDARPGMPGLKSRYCTAKLCPDPVHAGDELLEFLVAEGRRLDRPGILFPASDPFVLFVSRYRDELSPWYRFALPSTDVMEAIVDKSRQYEMAEEVGTPYPRTFYPESLAEVERIKDLVDYPAFIKPHYGHLWREIYDCKGFQVHNPAELEERFAQILPSGLRVMVQSIIPGPNTSHFKVSAYIGQTGEPLAVFTLRKIRQWPTEFGIGTMVESLNYPEMRDLGLHFFRAIGYRGIGSIEFKKDARDGKLKMIELNPRLWLQNGLATDCGMNFPLIQYLDLSSQDPVPLTTFRERVCWLDSMDDLRAFWSYHKQGELSVRAWLGSVSRARSFATFALDDPGPFLSASQWGLKYVKGALHVLRSAGPDAMRSPR